MFRDQWGGESSEDEIWQGGDRHSRMPIYIAIFLFIVVMFQSLIYRFLA
jgi:hypothetical protein